VDGELSYFTKAGHPIRITDQPDNIMEAIVLYVRARYPDLSPSIVVDDYQYGTKPRNGEVRLRRKLSRAKELHVEFVAMKEGRSYLKGLFHKECLDPVTKRLNTVDFTYDITTFDVVFDEDDDDLPYFKRYTVLADALADHFTPAIGRRLMCDHVDDAEHMLDVLLSEEGLVFHQEDSRACWKVKMPRVVMNLRIVAVANTIGGECPNFIGYNLVYVAAPDAEDDTKWSVIHVFDWTELFTKFTNPSQGRAYINPASVKLVEGGRLGCTSSCESMQPLVNAVFRAVSGSVLLPACSPLTKTKATVRLADSGTVTVACGANRSFSFFMNGMTRDNGPLFLAEPVDVAVGCSELWEIGNEQLHLQPAWILALERYGAEEYLTMLGHTSVQRLLEIARDHRNDPVENYRRVGMCVDPFLGLRKAICGAMTSEFFFVRR